jgi:hypothetical protein
MYILSVWRTQIRDPVPFWPLDPGWVTNQDPDPGFGSNMNIRELRNNFWVKILKNCRSGSGVGSGINKFGSGSGQPFSRMNLKQNFSDKIHNYSTKCTIKINKNLFFLKNFPKNLHKHRIKYLLQNGRLYVSSYSKKLHTVYRRNFTNKVRVCCATLSKRKPALPDPKKIRTRSRNLPKNRIRSRIRNKSLRIHNPDITHHIHS